MDKFIVYIIKPSDNKFVKIGMTVNLEARMQNFQTSNPYRIDLVYKFICNSRMEMIGLEKDLHEYLSHYRVNFGGGSEWFKIEAVGQLVRLGMMGRTNKDFIKKHTLLASRAYELSVCLDHDEKRYYSEMKSAKAAEKKRSREYRAKRQEKINKLAAIKQRDYEKEMLDDLYEDQRNIDLDPDRSWHRY